MRSASSSRWHRERRTRVGGAATASSSNKHTGRFLSSSNHPSPAPPLLTSRQEGDGDDTLAYDSSSRHSNNNQVSENHDARPSADDVLPGACAFSRTRTRSGDDGAEWDPTDQAAMREEGGFGGNARIVILPNEAATRRSATIQAKVVNQETQTRRWWSRPEIRLIVGVTALSIVIATSLFLLVASFRQRNNSAGNSNSSATPTTLAEECSYMNGDISSDPFLQCECFHELQRFDDDVQYYYNSIKESKEMVNHVDHDMQTTSCAPDNIALVWIALEVAKMEEGKGEMSFKSVLTRFALACIYTTGGGSGWTDQTQWLSGESECLWYGVDCDTDGHVTMLNLTKNNVQGKLDTRIGLLRDLESIDLAHNRVTGSIPVELWSLQLIEELILGDNMLSGSLPPDLDQFSSLKKISLSETDLTGSLPRLFGLSNLKELLLDGTRLTGALPADDLLALNQLEILDLSYIAGLTGTLPSSFDALTNLKVFNIEGSTHLTGHLEDIIGNMANTLRLFSASYTAIAGHIPSALGNLTNLDTLNMASAFITGTLPSEIGMCTLLENVRLSINRLEGTIPTEMGKLSSLRSLQLSLNLGLSGSVPTGFAELEKLLILDVRSTLVTGSIPSEICERGGNVRIDGSNAQICPCCY